MPETCGICQHAKREAIEAALSSRRLLPVVSTQFRVKKVDLETHLQHAKEQALSLVKQALGQSRTEDPRQVLTDAPLHRVVYHFREAASAWREVEESDRSIDRLQMILQEAFADENMGLS